MRHQGPAAMLYLLGRVQCLGYRVFIESLQTVLVHHRTRRSDILCAAATSVPNGLCVVATSELESICTAAPRRASVLALGAMRVRMRPRRRRCLRGGLEAAKPFSPLLSACSSDDSDWRSSCSDESLVARREEYKDMKERRLDLEEQEERKIGRKCSAGFAMWPPSLRNLF